VYWPSFRKISNFLSIHFICGLNDEGGGSCTGQGYMWQQQVDIFMSGL
jgi:hypothetical protein